MSLRLAVSYSNQLLLHKGHLSLSQASLGKYALRTDVPCTRLALCLEYRGGVTPHQFDREKLSETGEFAGESPLKNSPRGR